MFVYNGTVRKMSLAVLGVSGIVGVGSFAAPAAFAQEPITGTGQDIQVGDGGTATLAGGTFTFLIANGGIINGSEVTVMPSTGFPIDAVDAANGGKITLTGDSTITSGFGFFFGVQPTGTPVVLDGTNPLFNMTGGKIMGEPGVNENGVVALLEAFGTGQQAFLDGVTVQPSKMEAIQVFDSTDASVTLTNSNVSGDPGFPCMGSPNSGVDGCVLRSVNGSTATLSANNNSVLTGDIFTDASSTANITLNDTRWTGALTEEAGTTSDETLQNGTVWNMTDNSNVTGTLTNNASMIEFSPPALAANADVQSNYKTLTVKNYVGGPGSEIGLNTFLGTDGSASDRLVIDGGSATGTTTLVIKNHGGPGAETTGNGILVVQTINDGTTSPGSFKLTSETGEGAFEYVLEEGGLIVTDFPEDWFLRDTFEEKPLEPTPTPEPPEEIVNPADPVFPVVPPTQPPPPGAPPELLPIIGPRLATYGVVQPIAREMGLMTLGTLQQRIGDTAANLCATGASPDGPLTTKAPPATTTGCCPTAAASSGGALVTKAPPVAAGSCRPAVWGRFFGQEVNNQYQEFADPRASGWMGGFQGGIDLFRGSLWGLGSDVAGLYFSYGTGTIDVSGLVTNPEATAYILSHTGKLGLTAYSAGGYWTHYGPSGWYLDAVLQGTFYDGSASTQFTSLPTRGSGFVSSLEGGYPIPLPVFGPGFVLEPQAQIIYQQVAFDDASDAEGPVDLGTTSGATGRLGVRGQWTIVGENGELWQPYVRANVWRDWDAQAKTMFGIDQVPTNEQATRLEFAGGLTTKINPHLSFYGQAGYQFAVSETTAGVERNVVQADVGVSYQW